MRKKISFFTAIFILINLIQPKEATAVMVDRMVLDCGEEAPARILASEVYRQTFVSEANSFGIISVKFANYQDISDDSLIFRFKELNSNDWYFEYTHRVDQMLDNKFFTFGIPPITNALGKEYVFELESISGKPDDSIGVFLSQNDCHEGVLTLNDKPQGKDIIFKLVEGVPAQTQLKNDIIHRLSDDPLFFVLWFAITAVTLALLLKK